MLGTSNDVTRLATRLMNHEQTEDIDLPDYLSQLWCVFVHDIMYGLEWDWQDSKWIDKID